MRPAVRLDRTESVDVELSHDDVQNVQTKQSDRECHRGGTHILGATGKFVLFLAEPIHHRFEGRV